MFDAHCLAFQYLSLSSRSTKYPFFPDSLINPSNLVTSAWAFLSVSEEARRVKGDVVE